MFQVLSSLAKGFLVVFIFLFGMQIDLAYAASKTIAITQIVGHPALDKVRKGILDELAENGYVEGKTARILFENAQGNIVLATQIAQQFVANHPDVIVAIATPSAQAAANAAKNTGIPIVFASVSDPVQARLVTNLKKPGKNITGTRNITPMDKEIDLMRAILPQLKTIGIIINYGEANSVQLLQNVKDAAERFNIQVKVAAAPTSAEVQTATASLMGQVDALLLLQDNTVASALPAVLKITIAKKVPVFSTYLDAVKAGALAGLAFDEYLIGKQTGKIVVHILAGKNPGDIAVEDPHSIELAVNLRTAEQLNITLPPALIKKAQQVYRATSAVS